MSEKQTTLQALPAGSFPPLNNGEIRPQDTRVDDYLEKRANNPGFVMVEFGHDSLPVAYHQGFEFAGKKAYIGVEGWLRDPIGIKKQGLARLRADLQNDQNTFFTNLDTGGVVNRDDPKDAWYDGQYNTVSLLPDGAADEVFASNVFCDPLIAYDKTKISSLLGELRRTAGNDATVILRETLTPRNTEYRFNDELFMSAGLAVTNRVTPDIAEDWEKLERVYKADPTDTILPPNPSSFYLFLVPLAR